MIVYHRTLRRADFSRAYCNPGLGSRGCRRTGAEKPRGRRPHNIHVTWNLNMGCANTWARGEGGARGISSGTDLRGEPGAAAGTGPTPEPDISGSARESADGLSARQLARPGPPHPALGTTSLLYRLSRRGQEPEGAGIAGPAGRPTQNRIRPRGAGGRERKVRLKAAIWLYSDKRNTG